MMLKLLAIHGQNNKLQCTPCSTNKLSIDYRLKYKVKLTRETQEEKNLCDLTLGTTKATIKEQIDKVNFIKLRNTYSLKNTAKRIKDKARNGSETYKSYIQ